MPRTTPCVPLHPPSARFLPLQRMGRGQHSQLPMSTLRLLVHCYQQVLLILSQACPILRFCLSGFNVNTVSHITTYSSEIFCTLFNVTSLLYIIQE